MLKLVTVLYVVLTCLTLSNASEELLEERFKTYSIRLEHEDTLAEPAAEGIKINNEKVTIWAPEINQETMHIKPRPEKVAEALKHPGEFFRKDAEKAYKNFREFSHNYQKCINSKKWPQKAECLNMLDICFGTDLGPSLCDWEQHETISKCAPQHKKKKRTLRLFEQ